MAFIYFPSIFPIVPEKFNLNKLTFLILVISTHLVISLNLYILSNCTTDVISFLFLLHSSSDIFPSKSSCSNFTYSLGFFLSEEEYQAGKNGELYLWYSMDEAQSVEDLQLIFLSRESLP